MCAPPCCQTVICVAISKANAAPELPSFLSAYKHVGLCEDIYAAVQLVHPYDRGPLCSRVVELARGPLLDGLPGRLLLEQPLATLHPASWSVLLTFLQKLLNL